MKGKILLKNKIKEYINNYLVLKLEGGGDHSQAGWGGGVVMVKTWPRILHDGFSN